MTRVTVRIEGHYEVLETPFSRSYEWHPASLILVCDCGQELTLTSSSDSSTSICECGEDHSALINDLQEREGQLRQAIAHPWRYEAKEQSDQHLRDEATYPEGSSWRYNDVTSANIKRES
jgi:hypothetical protein